MATLTQLPQLSDEERWTLFRKLDPDAREQAALFNATVDELVKRTAERTRRELITLAREMD